MFFSGVAGLICVFFIFKCVSENRFPSKNNIPDFSPASVITQYHELYTEIESQDIFISPVISTRFLMTLNLTIRDVFKAHSVQIDLNPEPVENQNTISRYKNSDTLLLSYMLNKAISENLHSIFDERVINGKQIINKKYGFLESAILKQMSDVHFDFSILNEKVKHISDSIAQKYLPKEYIKYPDLKHRDTIHNIFYSKYGNVSNKWVHSLLKYESILGDLGLQNVPDLDISMYTPLNDKIIYQEELEIYNLSKPLQYKFKWIAEFWSDDYPGVTYSPATRWISILNQILKKESGSFQEVQNIYFLMSLVLHETAVSCWNIKYNTLQVRPSVIIQTKIDPIWKPFHDNPPFPAYPSGHSAFGAAASSVLEYFFGRTYTFTDNSHKGVKAFLSEPRSFSSFREMAEENALSRLYLGVHFRKDCEDGLHLGNKIAQNILKNIVSETSLNTDSRLKLTESKDESILLEAMFSGQN